MQNTTKEKEQKLTTGEPLTVRVIVARHNEPVDWLPAVPEDYEIYISNSGETPVDIPKKAKHKIQIVKVPNKGREAGHWLRYVADNYDKLADINVFLQGSPHIGHTADILFHMERSDLSESFGYLTSKDCHGSRIDGNARTLIQSAVGRAYAIVPQASGGVWGGQHYAKREVLANYQRQHYLDILEFADTDNFAHKIEHAYNCVYGIPPKA